MGYTCENCKGRFTWDCDDGRATRKCEEFELDESTLDGDERRMLRALRQVIKNLGDKNYDDKSILRLL